MYRFSVIVFLLVLNTFSIARGQERDNDYYGRYKKAPYEDLLGSVEKHHMYKGIDNLYARQYDYALNEFVFILNYFPNHPQALMLYIDAAFGRRMPHLAEERILKALKLFPGYATTEMAYGSYLLRMGKANEAVAAYQRAIEYEPDFAMAHYNLALVYLEQKKLDWANWHAQKSYELGASLPGLRNMLEQRKAWKKAVDLTSLPDGKPLPQKKKFPLDAIETASASGTATNENASGEGVSKPTEPIVIPDKR